MSRRHRPAVEPSLAPQLGRRRFVQGIAAAGIVAALPRHLAHAAEKTTKAGEPTILTGTHFDLTIERLTTNITGKLAPVIAINGMHPGPTLRWRQGDDVTIAVTNKLTQSSSIHWHGIRTSSEMDGVPGLSFAGIAPGETFHYRIPVRQSGTYWYHSHSDFQEQLGHAGALIIDPDSADPIAYDRDYVVMLSDWSDENPDTIYANLLKGSGSDKSKSSAGPDLADVGASVYTFLINGKSPLANWTALFEPGQRVRLRFINGSAMTYFDVRIPGLKMSVVAADGNAIVPIEVDEFRMATAECYDVIVKPEADRAYTIFVQPLSRGGYARGTLAPKLGMSAEIPPMDPVPTRTMIEMGMPMGNASPMSSMPAMPDMHSMHAAGNHGMRVMHHPFYITRPDIFGIEPLPQPGPHTPRFVPAPGTPVPVVRTESVPIKIGPSISSVVANPQPRLADPGDGLRNNGRRVLAYADLRALFPGVDGRPPSREIELHLTGNMSRYIWGFDGFAYPNAEPVSMKLGERLRIILINDTMMEHPIHLHGLWGELENGNGAYLPYKHTISVKPAEKLSYLVSADAPGRWAHHCHLLYHLEAGMFRAVVVS
ncbi:MAG: multicopper oxidase domain-containing protein [Candidatus Acidiferrales bacterium]